MAYEDGLHCISMEAAADLSSYQYRFVKVSSAGKAALCDAGELARGVLQNAPSASGYAASVGIDGVTKVVAVSGVAAGDKLASDSAGRATKATAGTHIRGIARESCTTTGTIITMDLVYGYQAS